jgi:hypothetical protein
VSLPKKGEIWTKIHTGRMPHDHEDRDQGATKDPQILAVKLAEIRFSLTALRNHLQMPSSWTADLLDCV